MLVNSGEERSVDIELIKEVVDYNPETGVFIWKVREGRHFKRPGAAVKWNERCAGKDALTYSNPFGYRMGTILGWPIIAHRLAWAISYGSFPSLDIDHINGDPSDNRIVNLRACGKSRNQKNRKANANNKSGFSGVNWRESHKKWRAAFRHNGKENHVGYFLDPSDAYDALVVARAKYGFTDRHGK